MLKYFLACGIAVAFLGPSVSVSAKDGFQVLYAFRGGSDGAEPYGGVIADQAGNFYGATQTGGSTNCGGYGCGTIFKITPGGQEVVLYAFAGGSDGDIPYGGLIADQAGNLYGTTREGGSSGCFRGTGCGTVFKIAPDGTETVLHAFTGGDGASPLAGLVADSSENLYGTTYLGGAGCNNGGCGTVFKIANNGTETVLHSFGGGDGKWPEASLILDNAGSLYGTTWIGGKGGCYPFSHCGGAFSLTNGAIRKLHAFAGGTDGQYPETEMTADQAGSLYGTTVAGGGNTGCGHSFGCGTLFKIAPDGTETVLYSFCKSSGCPDGFFPLNGLIADGHGNFYGMTSGQGACGGCSAVFKFAPDGTLKVLHTFRARHDGAFPTGKLLMDQAGYLYGTATYGGRGYGTVFKLRA